MQKSLLQKVRYYEGEHIRNKRWKQIVIAMACVVACCTSYALIVPGATMTKDAYCGKESHTHTEDCYERALVCGQEEAEPHQHTDACYETRSVLVCDQEESAGHAHSESCYDEEGNLICGQEESVGHTHGESCYQEESVLVCQQPTGGHTHTDACYGEKLVCGKEEHTHSLSCYSNPAADVETASVWERTLPQEQELSGVWAEDVIAVAKSQIGYTESTANYTVLEDGTTTKGYTRYGAWYGDPYGDWCAMFVSFCLHYAQVENIPLDSNCQSWIEALAKAELYQAAEGYTPQPSQIIFFYNNKDGVANHVGLVSAVGDEKIEVIEGNSGDTVRYVNYALDDDRIFGYGLLPEQPEEEATVTKTAAIYTDESYTTLAEDATVIILTGAIPQDAEVFAYPKQVEIEQLVCAYDISILMPDGTSFEPDAEHPISVRIQLPDAEAEGQTS